MGRIKQKYLKRAGEKLMSEYTEEFDRDYESNKKKVMEFTNVKSKSVRNKIAGYITKKKNQQVKAQAREQALQAAASKTDASSQNTTSQ